MSIRFSNSELCRTWAQQTQEYADGSNIYFKGRSLYGFGGTREIARLIGKDKNIVFISRRHSYPILRKFIKRSVPVFTSIFLVESFDNHYVNINYYHNQIKETLDKVLQIRMIKHFDHLLKEAEEIANDLLHYVALFGIEPDEKTRILEYKMEKNGGLITEEKRRQLLQKKEEWMKQQNERNWRKIQKWETYTPTHQLIRTEMFRCSRAKWEKLLASSYDRSTYPLCKN